MTATLDEDCWNSINLIPPTYSTYSVSRNDFDIKSFKKLIEDAIKQFSDQAAFNNEVSQISQFIYVGSIQFRMMKGFWEMKKTHQAAIRLKRFDIVSILEAFNSYVSDDFQAEITLPYRQSLDYLLIKLQGLSKVLIRIIICSRKSARYFLGLIRHGSFYIKGSIFTSTLSRVWNLSRQMCIYTVCLYNNLRIFRYNLKVLDNLEWTAKDYKFPETLEDWLGDEYEFYVNNETYDTKLLVKSEDVENFRKNITQILDIFKQLKTESIETDLNRDEELHVINEIKVEESTSNKLEIDDLTPISRIQDTDIIEDYEHSLSLITTRKYIKLFIKFEDRYRKVDAGKSITVKKIKQKTWKEIKSDLKNKLLLMQEDSLVEYFHDNLNYFLSNE